MSTLEEARTELRAWLADLDALKSHAENFNAREFIDARDAALGRAKEAAKVYALAVGASPAKKSPAGG